MKEKSKIALKKFWRDKFRFFFNFSLHETDKTKVVVLFKFNLN